MGTTSPSLAFSGLVCAMEHRSNARHISVCLNVIADQLSHKRQALHSEWSLHPDILLQICQSGVHS